MFYVHLRSLALLTTYKTSSRLKAAAYRVQGQHLASLAFYDAQNEPEPGKLENGHFYVAYLNDGIDLLNQHSNSSDLVTTLGFHNPFSYALLRKPATGGNTWWLFGNNISTNRLPSGASMLGNATIVMTPKYPSSHRKTDQALFDLYQPYLLANFSLVAESEWWRLYRRKTG
jgi:hypothetical protein